MHPQPRRRVLGVPKNTLFRVIDRAGHRFVGRVRQASGGGRRQGGSEVGV